MITLAVIAHQLSDSMAEHARWKLAVRKLALSDDDKGVVLDIAHERGINIFDGERRPLSTRYLRDVIVARFDAAERELEALRNVERDLISNGRTETPFSASMPKTAPETPPPHSSAL